MAGFLDDIVDARGDEPAVVDANGTTTWAELDRRVSRLVHALRARGLRSGDSVVVMLGNQVQLVEVSFACMQAGWLLVPVNWHWVAEELAYVLGDADAAALVVDGRWLPVAVDALAISPTPGLRVSVAVDGEAAEFEQYGTLLAAAPDCEIADTERGGPMFYTSGTTGRPKGVRSALAQVGGSPEIFARMAHSARPLLELPVEGSGVQAICGPMYHSAQWVIGTFAVLCGATLVLQHHFDADELLELVDRHAVTNLHLVPAQMVRLLDLPVERREHFDSASLRALLHGAAPCRPDVKRRMIEWLGPIVTEYYGGTEGGFISTISAAEWLERPGSVGKPLPIVEVVVVGKAGEPQGPNEQGDLYFRNVMGRDFEYHKAPDKTASAHLTGGLGTLGDIGYLDEDGYLYLSDRRIDMIVSGGVNIYPAEIEGVLAEHEAVTDVAVFGIPDREMGEQVKAAVSLSPSHTWDGDLEAELMALCRARLAGYKCPRTFDVHAELPRNEAGKLTKRVLRDPYWAGEHRSI
jgi:long-chain acyl-CoA synthetase